MRERSLRKREPRPPKRNRRRPAAPPVRTLRDQKERGISPEPTTISVPLDPGGRESYLKSAPHELILQHENMQIVAVGHKLKVESASAKLLGKLLTDKRMERAWSEIQRRLASNLKITPRKLYREIFYAFRKSGAEHFLRQQGIHHIKKPPRERGAIQPRRLMSAKFEHVAKNAGKLAADIAEGPLDLLAYHLFPDINAQIVFGVPQWSQLPQDTRDNMASPAPAAWPSIVELLEQLAERAKRDADKALRTRRLVDRDTLNREFNFFVRHLGRFFNAHLGTFMPAPLASLASVAFNGQYDKASVRRALRHMPL